MSNPSGDQFVPMSILTRKIDSMCLVDLPFLPCGRKTIGSNSDGDDFEKRPFEEI